MIPFAPSPQAVPNWTTLRGLLNRLTKFSVPKDSWGSGSDDPSMGLGADREAAVLEEAHVTSSLIRNPNTFMFGEGVRTHAVLLDIDREAWLVKSTNRLNHLYVGIECREEDYFDFLRAAAKIGLIEQGYANVSIERGHTDLRLPWVRKGQEKTAAEQNLEV